jgi:hypothetical protein
MTAGAAIHAGKALRALPAATNCQRKRNAVSLVVLYLQRFALRQRHAKQGAALFAAPLCAKSAEWGHAGKAHCAFPAASVCSRAAKRRAGMGCTSPACACAGRGLATPATACESAMRFRRSCATRAAKRRGHQKRIKIHKIFILFLFQPTTSNQQPETSPRPPRGGFTELTVYDTIKRYGKNR